MKQSNELLSEEAKILLQTQALSSALWLASSEQLETIAFRLPDPSYVDSLSWPNYMKKSKPVVKKPNENIDFIKKPIKEIEIQTIPIQEPKQIIALESLQPLEEDSTPKILISENQIPERPKIKKTQPVKTKSEPKLDIKPIPIKPIEVTIDPPVTIKSKRILKNLDFYQWLEELKTVPRSAKKAKTVSQAKLALSPSPKTTKDTKKIIESSVELGQEIISETLAKLLARQGHKTEAIEMYQKLMVKFPEKRSTFATAIEKLKT